MEALALGVLGVSCGEFVGAVGGVVDHAGEDDGAAGGEGAARPPHVEGGGVSVPDGFLAGGFAVDGV